MYHSSKKNGDHSAQFSLFRAYIKQYIEDMQDIEDDLYSILQLFIEGNKVTNEQFEYAKNLISHIRRRLQIYYQSLEEISHISNVISYGQALVTAIRYCNEQAGSLELLLIKFGSLPQNSVREIRLQLEIYYSLKIFEENYADVINKSHLFLDQSYFQEKILTDMRLMDDKSRTVSKGRVISLTSKLTL